MVVNQPLSVRLCVTGIIQLMFNAALLTHSHIIEAVAKECLRKKGTCQIFDEVCLAGRLAIASESAIIIYSVCSSIYAFFAIIAHCCVSEWFFLRTIFHHIYLSLFGIAMAVSAFAILISLDTAITELPISLDFMRCQNSYHVLFNWNLAAIIILACAIILHVATFGMVYAFSRNQNFLEHFRGFRFRGDGIKVLPLIQESSEEGALFTLGTVPGRSRLASTRHFPSSPILPAVITNQFDIPNQFDFK